jgi:triosephosphate isomerase (TIM)
MEKRKPFIAGNWKMNLDVEESVALVKAIAADLQGLEGVDVLVAPPFTNLHAVREAIGKAPIFLGAQNMHWELSGAYTGEVSGKMLLEAGCSHVILGHSERRTLFHETDEVINLKAKTADESGLIPILCVGETLEEREAEKTFGVVTKQLDDSMQSFREQKRLPENLVLAYEPVWAIGTGKTASPEQAQEVHRFIRDRLERNFGSEAASRTRILYGGSVKPENVAALMSKPDIDGALVGGASLKAGSFLKLVRFREG